jgi:hypothetical protein
VLFTIPLGFEGFRSINAAEVDIQHMSDSYSILAFPANILGPIPIEPASSSCGRKYDSTCVYHSFLILKSVDYDVHGWSNIRVVATHPHTDMSVTDLRGRLYDVGLLPVSLGIYLN